MDNKKQSSKVYKRTTKNISIFLKSRNAHLTVQIDALRSELANVQQENINILRYVERNDDIYYRRQQDNVKSKLRKSLGFVFL